MLSSAVAAFFYVRIIVLMFFSDPIPDGPEVVVPNVFTGTVVGLASCRPSCSASCRNPS